MSGFGLCLVETLHHINNFYYTAVYLINSTCKLSQGPFDVHFHYIDNAFICIIIIIIMAGMAVFNVAGYLIEERRRWPVITASPRGQCSK